MINESMLWRLLIGSAIGGLIAVFFYSLLGFTFSVLAGMVVPLLLIRFFAMNNPGEPEKMAALEHLIRKRPDEEILKMGGLIVLAFFFSWFLGWYMASSIEPPEVGVFLGAATAHGVFVWAAFQFIFPKL